MKRFLFAVIVFTWMVAGYSCVTKNTSAVLSGGEQSLTEPAAEVSETLSEISKAEIRKTEVPQKAPSVRRYFRPSANVTPALPKSVPDPVFSAEQELSLPAAASQRESAVRIIDRSAVTQNNISDTFYFSAMVFRFNTSAGTARIQFEHVPSGAAGNLIREGELFQTLFPTDEFTAIEEKQIAVAGGGVGVETSVSAVGSEMDPLETPARLLSLLLQRPVEISRNGAVCQFSFACDPVMTFSSPNSYGMYTNKGGERVTLSFNLENDPEVRFRLAY